MWIRSTLFGNPFPVWRDPLYPGGGERLFAGLLTLLGLAVGVQFLAELARLLLPFLIGVTVMVGLVVWLVGRHRRW